jgi:hypothetical protein
MRNGLVGLALAAALIVGGARLASADAGGCHVYSGSFTAVTIPPGAECSSFLFCTRGTLTGDLAGTYDFTVTGITPGGALTGQSTITLDNGAVINGSDTSVLNPDGTFVTTLTVVAGTRQFAHARGGLVASGQLTPSGTEGLYSSVICLGIGAAAADTP